MRICFDFQRLDAGADLHLGAADEITLASGQDSHWSVGGAYRLHTGQAIGMLAGAIAPGTEAAGTGLTLIAGNGDTELQAQADPLQIAARDQVTLLSQDASTTFAAPRKLTAATAGGASVVIEGGEHHLGLPGDDLRLFECQAVRGPEKVDYTFPPMPRQVCVACLLNAAAAGSAFAMAG